MRLLKTKPDYLSVRYIGQANDGRELVRVDRVGKKMLAVSEKNLQSKGRRRYFQKAQTLRNYQVYFTEVNLNREFSKIVDPHTPVLRSVIPIYSEKNNKRFFEAAVINVDISNIFESLRNNILADRKFYVTNSAGDYLYHPNSEKSFGFEFGKETRIQRMIPNLSDAFMGPSQNNSAIVHADENGENFAVYIHKVALNKDTPERFLGLISVSDYKNVTAAFLSVGRPIVLSSFLVTGLAIVLEWVFAKTLTQPLIHITREIASFGEGKTRLDLPANATDEVGLLARTFDKMTLEIREWTQRLEETIRERKQAEESFRRVVESTPNGLLMVGRDRKITLANSQTEKLFGYAREQLLGQSEVVQ